MSQRSELTKKWYKYLNSKNPDDLEEIWEKAKGLVFFVAYKNTEGDRIKTVYVVGKVFKELEDSDEKPISFENWITDLTKDISEGL